MTASVFGEDFTVPIEATTKRETRLHVVLKTIQLICKINDWKCMGESHT